MKTTVYRYYNADNELLYVGITKNQLNRFEAHSKVQPWFHEISKAFFQHTDTREEALEYEKYIIANEFPKYNKAGPVLPDNLYAHLESICREEFDDFFHARLHFKMQEILNDINKWSSASEPEKMSFSFGNSLTYDEAGEYPLIDCFNCQNIFDSKWFKVIYDDAQNLICDEVPSE